MGAGGGGRIMAYSAVRTVAALDRGFILTPERYDPRRAAGASGGVRLGDLASFGPPAVPVSGLDADQAYLVLDTGDAAEGVIRPRNRPVLGGEVGSAKKTLLPGDVIISRLRPYLRQVGYVDEALSRNDTPLLASSEFFVLRPGRGGRSLAFLAPFLLSRPAQTVLGAAQEGGHHPRFTKRTLQDLSVPRQVVDDRDAVSARYVAAVEAVRDGLATVTALAERCGEAAAG